MATIVQFEQLGVEYGAPLVHSRANWTDAWHNDSAQWHAPQATWSAAPSLDTAAIVQRYGERLMAGDQAFGMVSRDVSMLGRFVRLRFPMRRVGSGAWEYRDWFGIAELVEDDLGGVSFTRRRGGTTGRETGTQLYTAYGLEKMLADWPITYSFVNDGGTARRVERPLTFNADGRPNRSASIVDGTHVFEHDLTTAKPWKLCDIVDYLLERQTPRHADETVVIPWSRVGAGLPDWQRVVLPQEEATTLSLLQQLVTRSNGLSFRATVKESVPPAADEAQLHVFSLLDAPLVLPVSGAPSLERNGRRRDLRYDGDARTTATVKTSRVGGCDQVLVRGARKRSVGNFSFADGTLLAGWDATLQSPYDAGASGEAGYAALDDEEKRKLDATARSSARFDEVYAYFKIPPDWDGKVGDGIGGAKEKMFPKTVGPTPFNAVPWYGEAWILPTIPLWKGFDYAGDRVESGAVSVAEWTEATKHEEQAPLVVFLIPGTSPSWPLARWSAGEKLAWIGTTPDRYTTENVSTFSVAVDVPDKSHGVELRVSGEMQHAIAKTDFSALPVDLPVGGYDWREAILVLALEWDDHVEGAWPAELPDLDAPRVRVFYAGNEFRKDYVAPNTVVGIDADGSLLRSTGGWLPTEAADDDEHQLRAMARVAYEWFGRERRVLTLDTAVLLSTGQLDVGDLIEHVGEPAGSGGSRLAIGTVVTQVSIAWPEGDGGDPPAPRLQFSTDAGELDPMQAASDPALRSVSPRFDITDSALTRVFV